MSTAKELPCADCGTETAATGGGLEGAGADAYQLKDAIWLSVARADEILCTPCFEKRLGRQLTAADYDLEAPINYINGYFDILQAPPDVWEQLRPAGSRTGS